MSVVEDTLLRLALSDPERALRAVRLRGDLWKRRTSPEFRRARDGSEWELRLPRPASVDRVEYQLELVGADGRSELVCDPANPLRVPGPFGDRSVLELPGYEAPAWIDDLDAPRGTVRRLSIPVRALRGRVRGLLWTAAGATRGRPLPLLVVHDGPEYAEYALLLRFLDSATAELELPPMRAALLAPVQRDEHYSASARYGRALATEIVPAVAQLRPTHDDPRARVGMGASLGALAMLHAHRVQPGLFGAVFLQSGSFFRRRLDGQEARFGRFARITRFTSALERAQEPPNPIRVAMTCGTGEENLANNRETRDALAAQGYPVTLHEHRDAHNWVSWRDSFVPPLVRLLQDLWG